MRVSLVMWIGLIQSLEGHKKKRLRSPRVRRYSASLPLNWTWRYQLFPVSSVLQILEPPYDEIVTAHLRCTYTVGNLNFTKAYKCQTVIVQSFLQAIQAHKEENWALSIMYDVALDLWAFAYSLGSWKRMKSRNTNMQRWKSPKESRKRATAHQDRAVQQFLLHSTLSLQASTLCQQGPWGARPHPTPPRPCQRGGAPFPH